MMAFSSSVVLIAAFLAFANAEDSDPSSTSTPKTGELFALDLKGEATGIAECTGAFQAGACVKINVNPDALNEKTISLGGISFEQVEAGSYKVQLRSNVSQTVIMNV
jgi:hypothetical protein